MYRILHMGVSCLLLIFLSSCVAKTEFDTVSKEYTFSQKQLKKLKKEKIQLDDQIKTLKKIIQEKEVVISVQGKIIKFIDDSNQTLQKSIEDQVAAKNIKK